MAINIPSLANPYDPTTPLANAYGWISGITLDLARNTGQAVLAVNPHESAWQGTPLTQIVVSLGQQLTAPVAADPVTGAPETPATYFPTLSELMADPEFAAAFNTVGAKLYQAMLAIPELAGATVV